MVLQAPNYRRPPKARENEPPIPKPSNRAKAKTLASRIRTTVQESSRRRRGRPTGEARYAVGQARQHRSRIKSISNIVRFRVAAPQHSPSPVENKETDMKDDSPELLPHSPLSITTAPVSLPRFLQRPSFREVSKTVLSAIEPDLKHTNLDYIMEGLEHLGPQMLQVLTGVQAEPIKSTLPKELGILVNDLSSDPPTHMLALYSRHPPEKTTIRRSVTLFPTHNIVLAAHCANLPQLPQSNPACPKKAGEKITLPIIPLCIPSPQTFPQLSAYLYTKNATSLLTSLFSTRPPLSLSLEEARTVNQFAGKLAGTYTTQALLHQIMMVNGIWRNVCALGVFDDALWDAMDVAWETLLTALGFATGNPQAMSDNS